MAKLQELIKGFRANVRAGFPCVLDFNGETIKLYGKSERWEEAWSKTFVGMCTKPSKQEPKDMPDILTYENTGIPRPEY